LLFAKPEFYAEVQSYRVLSKAKEWIQVFEDEFYWGRVGICNLASTLQIIYQKTIQSSPYWLSFPYPQAYTLGSWKAKKDKRF
jgi:hypothetical protein